MSFDELKKIIGVKYGSMKLSDIARELNVSPQVVSNWKSRNQVPYKYIKKMKTVMKGDKNVELSNEIYGYMPYKGSMINEKSLEENLKLSDIIDAYFKIAKTYYKYQLALIFLIVTSTYLYSKFYIEPVYASSARLLPLAEGGSSGAVSSLVQRFGISGSSSPAGMSSSDMYPIVLQSRKLGYQLIEKRFDTKQFGKNRRLIDILFKDNSKVEKNYTQNQKRSAVSKILKKIYVRKPRSTNLITLKVEAHEAQLAALIVDSVIEILQKIMRSYNLGQTYEKKEFINSRFEDVLNKLNISEENLKNFREKNRRVSSSPQLMLEEARLFRETEVQTEIYITLKTQLEMVNVEESGKKSLVQILDSPEISPNPVRPKIYKNILYSFFFSILIGALVVISVDSYNRFYVKD